MLAVLGVLGILDRCEDAVVLPSYKHYCPAVVNLQLDEITKSMIARLAHAFQVFSKSRLHA